MCKGEKIHVEDDELKLRHDEMMEVLREIRDSHAGKALQCGELSPVSQTPCELPLGHLGHLGRHKAPYASWPSSRKLRAHSPKMDEARKLADIRVRDAVGGECAECGVPSNGHAVDCMRFDEDAEPASADVDPDEGLMAAMSFAFLGSDLKAAARAAREHIEANQLYAYRPVAAERDKAEADLARVTKERDTAERLANRNADTARDFEDRYETSHANFLAVSSDLDKAQAKADRYDALREDVVSLRDGWRRQGSGWTKSLTAVAADQVDGILTRDDKRMQHDA